MKNVNIFKTDADLVPIQISTSLQNAFSEQIKYFLKDTLAPPDWKIEIGKSNKLYLHTYQSHTFSIDYSKQKPLGRNQPLCKAIGFKGKPLKILDATAGWGFDTVLLASLKCVVTAVEENRLIFTFLKAALSQSKPELNIECLCLDSLSYLKGLSLSERPDVIYLDFMFLKQKKSLSKKPLCILQELLKKDEEKDRFLFEEALTKTKKRLVVKRHHSQKSFNKNYLCSFSGRSVCFDVFNGTRME